MIEKRRSKIEGWGVFATRPINKNTRIIHYAGEKITNRESLKREIRYLKSGHIWCFKLNRLYVRDAAVGGNIARYINHSCTPNCYTQVIGDTIWIRAARNIRRGIGSALMDWIEPQLAAAGHLSASLDTQESNIPARAFYESRGYRTTTHWLQTRFTRTPIPMVTLEKLLVRP